MWGLDINAKAALLAEGVADAVIIKPIMDFHPEVPRDLVLTKGFLIHIDPRDLPTVYARIYVASKRYILLCEYYAKEPTEVRYRGKYSLLWRRDFAGEMLDQFAANLRLVHYGFVYDRDPYPQDSINWFLLEKK